MSKKLKFVNVGWKYTTSRIVKSKKSAERVYDVHFPSVRFEGKDLKGRIRWTDDQWIKLAIKFFEKEKGFKLEDVKDTYVDRVYE
jgi:hypothetical protein